MTFPSAIKKSNQITISKTGSGSKTSPGSPKSPGSPLKLISRSSVKASPVTKDSEIANVASSIRKQSGPPKISPTSKPVIKLIIDAKSECTKTGTSSVTNEVKKSKTKPPPLKLNIKSTDTNGLQSPGTPKVVPKTPLTTSTKSPMANKLSSVAKSPLVSTGVVRSSQASNISVSVTKSPQVLAGTKTNFSLTVKSSNLSSPVNKSPKMSVLSKLSVVSSPATQSTLTSAVSKTSTMTAMNPKSPQLPSQHLTPTVKSIVSKTIIKGDHTSLKSVTLKDRATIVKPTNPGKNAPVLSTNTVAGVKLPTTPTNKSSTTSKSPSTASSIKFNSFKTTPTSPSKLLTKESSTTKISSIKVATTPNKSNIISKLGSTSPKAMVKNESSTLSLLSVKSSSTIKSTSVVSKPITLKTKVTPLVTSKNLVPKSPVAKTQKSTLSSPTVKTSSSPIIKTTSTPIMKTTLSPTVKTRSLPLSSAKPPLSPAIKKLVPTKLILSPGKSNSKSLSSSRLGSVSTESLASRTSLKSPMSPKPNKVVPRSPSKIIKKTEESKKLSSIRGEQSVKKTIDIPGIKELSSNLVINEQKSQNIECWLENSVKSVMNEEIESMITQMPDKDLSNSEKLEVHKMVVNIDESLEATNNFLNVEDIPTNTVNVQNVNQSPIQEHNLDTIEEDSIELSLIPLQEKQDEDICSSSDFVVVEKDECVPCLISQSANNCDIVFDDNHFNSIHENVIVEQLKTVAETQSCIIDIDDHFEPMNDKLVLGDVPFETDSSDISDNEQAVQKEIIETRNYEVTQENCVDDVFSFSEESLSIVNLNRADSTDDFIHQFMPKSMRRSEGSSSISTDDGSLPSRKSYSEALIGTPKDGEYYFDDVIDDCLDYDYEEEGSVFVEMTEKEFPELKPKDLAVNRRKNKKPKKRNSNRTESRYGKYNEVLMIYYNFRFWVCI